MRHEAFAGAAARLPGLALERRGDGPPLLLFHGGTGSRLHWARNIDALARRFCVHAFDLPGFGESPDVPPELEPDDYLDWIASQAAEIPGSLHIVGFSFGGAVAAVTARRLGGRVARLSLLGPGGFGNPVGRSIALKPMPDRDAPEAERRAVVAHNLGIWMLSKAPEPDDAAVDIQQYNIAHARFDSRSVSFRDTTGPALAGLGVPVQIIWGARDRIAYPSVEARADICRRANPSVAIHLVDGAGHWVQFEAADEVNALLLAFHLQENDA